MEQQKISVIVPVYKVEKYLNRCVQSVVNQTYRNLEIILVDDGSTDNCPAICDSWAKKDKRIKVIHKVNGGLSDARNVGMTAATGELIGFVDSDDWIAPDMYQHLHKIMEADNSDISVCGVKMVWEDGTSSRMLTKSGNCVLSKDEAMQAIIREDWLKHPVWYKLYKTALIRDIFFPVGKYHEDVFWSYQAIAKAERVSVSDQVGYYYFQRNGSIMGDGYSLKRLDAVEAKYQLLEFVRRDYPFLVSICETELFYTCLYHGQMALKYLNCAQVKQAFIFLDERISKLSCCSKDMILKNKCWVVLSKVNLKMTCKIRSMMGIGL